MSDISSAIRQICEEKALSYDAVITTIESALAAAYRKDFGEKNQNIKVEFDEDIAKSKVFDVKTVVEDMPEEPDEDEEDNKESKKGEDAKTDKKAEMKKKGEKGEPLSAKITEDKEKKEEKKDGKSSEELEPEEEVRKFNPRTEIQISEAKLIKKTAKVGDEIKTKLKVADSYGRMAAQTAKQVIIQRLREAERDMIYNDFKEKEGEVVSGVVQRREGRFTLVDLGKSVGVLPIDEQIVGESYRPGERIKVYVKEVGLKPKGPEIILSRTSDEILKKVFYLEIPEISNGLIELKGVAREAGNRSKVSVWTDSENVDPIGSCVGQRGARIQTIISELGGEKVDIIEYDDDPVKYIANALSPAKIINIDLMKSNKMAKVHVGADQLSLAIGKGGQNARLAAKLTGWRIDISEEKPKKAQEGERGGEGGEGEESQKTQKHENPVNPDKSGNGASTENTKTQKAAKDTEKKDVKKDKAEKEEKKDGDEKDGKKKVDKKEKKEDKKKEKKADKKDDKKESSKDVKSPSAKATEDKGKKVKEVKDIKREEKKTKENKKDKDDSKDKKKDDKKGSLKTLKEDEGAEKESQKAPKEDEGIKKRNGK